MKKKNNPFQLLWITIFLLAILIPANAQKGNPYISHFVSDQTIDRQVFDICQDPFYVMLFATRMGILSFDSEEWHLIETPDIVLSLAKDTLENKIYSGCNNDFGILERDQKGTYHYNSLSGLSYSGEITSIIPATEYIYFFSSDRISIVYRENSENQLYIDTESEEYFSGIFRHNNRVFVNSTKNGTYEFQDTNMVPLPTKSDIHKFNVVFSAPFNSEEIIIGTDNERLYLFNGTRFKDYTISDQEYLSESDLAGGLNIDENRLAISTVLGGCMIINKSNGNSDYIINYQTGLPDDEIYALGLDLNKGLWVSHEYGLSRIDMLLPVKNFNTYPGLSGNLVASTIYQDKLYLSTNEGIFFLEEKKEYLEKEILVRTDEPEPETVQEPEVEEEPDEQQPIEEDSDLSKRELRKLRRQQKKDQRKQEQEDGPSEEEVSEDEEGQDILTKLSKTLERPFKKSKEKDPDERKKPTFKKQKIYSLQSISHDFVKVTGLDEKSTTLLNMGDRILAGTHGGLYEIKGNEATLIFPDWYIEFIEPSLTPGKVFIGADNSVYLIELAEGEWKINKQFNEIVEDVYSLCEVDGGTIWFGCDNVAYKLIAVDSIQLIPYVFSEKSYDPVYLRMINDQIFFFLSSGIYSVEDDSVKQYDTGTPLTRIPEYLFSNKGIAWIKHNETWESIADTSIYNPEVNRLINLFDDIHDLYLDDSGDLWIIHENENIHKISSAQVKDFCQSSYLHMTRISNQEGTIYNLSNLLIDYQDRSLVFNFTAPCYLKSQSNQYQFYVDGLSTQWSNWDKSSEASFPVIPPGKYILRYKAKNVMGIVSEERALQFQINPPYWYTWWFIGICVLVLLGIVLLIIRLRIRKLQKDKRILEQKVKERTAEIERQKNEIAAQKQEIMDSIHYAQRIQSAVLPSYNIINQVLPENFILYLPRDIVSGDFYWMTQQGDWSIFAAADCTGHGVPGAFMSMLGVSMLNEIISKQSKHTASTMLDRLRELIMSTLSQSEESESKDGMDIALCVLNNKTYELQYSGAFNPLFIIRNGELIETKADRMPIGIYAGSESDFTNHKMKVEKGDCLYIFSDGYADQIGGEKGKKFLTKTFKQLLLKIHKEPMDKQKETLHQTITYWMGDFQQVDDILLIGIRI